MLVRCQTDESAAWRMVCGKCWKVASGGQVDGDARHPHYRYGGLWKNRKAVASAGRGLDAQSIVRDVSSLASMFRVWKGGISSTPDAPAGCSCAVSDTDSRE